MIPPESPKYVVNSQHLERMGPGPAVLLGVLSHLGADEAAVIPQKQLAAAMGISLSTCRRYCECLCKEGLLKVEPVILNHRRISNAYQVDSSESVHFDRTAQNDGTAQTGGVRSKWASESSSSTSSISPEVQVEEVLPSESSSATLRVTGGNPLLEPEPCGSPGAVRRRPEPGSPMPASGPKLSDIYAQAQWLTTHFGGYVLVRMNRERNAKGWRQVEAIPEERLDRWECNAMVLVSSHPLAEVAEVVDWIFVDSAGNLPKSVIEESDGRQDRKVTRLQQVQYHYPQLRSEMAGHRKETRPAQKPKANYGAPLNDQAMEAQVQRLVEQFAQFRHSVGDRIPDEHRIWAWAKTFRIALDTKARTFSDLTDVVAALERCRFRIDVSRYRDAFHLMAETEQAHLHRMVMLAERTEDDGLPEDQWREDAGFSEDDELLAEDKGFQEDEWEW